MDSHHGHFSRRREIPLCLEGCYMGPWANPGHIERSLPMPEIKKTCQLSNPSPSLRSCIKERDDFGPHWHKVGGNLKGRFTNKTSKILNPGNFKIPAKIYIIMLLPFISMTG